MTPPGQKRAPSGAPKVQNRPAATAQQKPLTPEQRRQKSEYLKGVLRFRIARNKQVTGDIYKEKRRQFLQSVQNRPTSAASVRESVFEDLHRWRFDFSGDFDRKGIYGVHFDDALKKNGNVDLKEANRGPCLQFVKKHLKANVPKDPPLTDEAFDKFVRHVITKYAKELDKQDPVGDLGEENIRKANENFLSGNKKNLDYKAYIDAGSEEDKRLNFSDLPGLVQDLQKKISEVKAPYNSTYRDLLQARLNGLKENMKGIAKSSKSQIAAYTAEYQQILRLGRLANEAAIMRGIISKDLAKNLPKKLKAKLKVSFDAIKLSTTAEGIREEHNKLKKVKDRIKSALQVIDKKKKKAAALAKLSEGDRKFLKDPSVLKKKLKTPFVGAFSASWYAAKEGISDEALRKAGVNPDDLPMLSMFRFFTGAGKKDWAKVPIIGGLVVGARKLFGKAKDWWNSGKKFELGKHKYAQQFLKPFNMSKKALDSLLAANFDLKGFLNSEIAKKHYAKLRLRVEAVMKARRFAPTMKFNDFLTRLQAKDVAAPKPAAAQNQGKKKKKAA